VGKCGRRKGDGAGAVILQSTEEDRGILTTKLHSDGAHAEELAFINPSCHGSYHLKDRDFGYGDNEYSGVFLTNKMMDEGMIYPNMTGQLVFKTAVKKFLAVIMEALNEVGKTPEDINMPIPHQANLRNSAFVQRILGLHDDHVWNNIHNYGNTTATSVSIALSEAVERGEVKDDDLVRLAAFGRGFTWGWALIRW